MEAFAIFGRLAARWHFIGPAALVIAASLMYAQQGAVGRGGPPAQSPASKRPPAARSAQSYSPAEIQAGEPRFVALCGFCHGRDAQGGESGPDLTRSPLVAEDDHGDKLGPLILSGRVPAGMPAFSLASEEIAGLVAFLHDARSKTESANGNRRSVAPEDLRTGDAEAGKGYFNGAGGCSKCHSLNGPFASVGARLQGLALLQRMLYPRNRGGRGATVQPRATVTTPAGETVSGKVDYRDEFNVTIIDADGWAHSFPLSNSAARVRLETDDPLQAHEEQLGKYTDEDMHNVFAFLETLR